jgi:acetolactate synthase-1/2/3 large subunit
MGDGSFIFGCPTAALWASNAYKTPFLSIIFNNQMYYAPRKSIEKTYGRESFSEKTGLWLGVDIIPSPDYALIARGCYAHGNKVEDPDELLPALRNGLDLVRSGTSVVLDIRIERP